MISFVANANVVKCPYRKLNSTFWRSRLPFVQYNEDQKGQSGKGDASKIGEPKKNKEVSKLGEDQKIWMQKINEKNLKDAANQKIDPQSASLPTAQEIWLKQMRERHKKIAVEKADISKSSKESEQDLNAAEDKKLRHELKRDSNMKDFKGADAKQIISKTETQPDLRAEKETSKKPLIDQEIWLNRIRDSHPQIYQEIIAERKAAQSAAAEKEALKKGEAIKMTTAQKADQYEANKVENKAAQKDVHEKIEASKQTSGVNSTIISTIPKTGQKESTDIKKTDQKIQPIQKYSGMYDYKHVNNKLLKMAQKDAISSTTTAARKMEEINKPTGTTINEITPKTLKPTLKIPFIKATQMEPVEKLDQPKTTKIKISVMLSRAKDDEKLEYKTDPKKLSSIKSSESQQKTSLSKPLEKQQKTKPDPFKTTKFFSTIEGTIGKLLINDIFLSSTIPVPPTCNFDDVVTKKVTPVDPPSGCGSNSGGTGSGSDKPNGIVPGGNRPIRQEPGKVFFCLIPAEWVQFFYPKTGVTGFGTLCVTFSTYLISKEIYVMEHDYYTGLSMLVMWSACAHFMGKDFAKFLDDGIDEYERDWNQDRKNLKNHLKGEIDNEQRSQFDFDGQLIVVEAKRENVQLQLEAEFRERQMSAYRKVKSILDYHVDIDQVERSFAHLHMVDWVYAEVSKSLTPEFDAGYMDMCMTKLESLSVK